MSHIRIEKTVVVSGVGSGPSLTELRVFLEHADSWPQDTRVKIARTEAVDQREQSAWSIELRSTV